MKPKTERKIQRKEDKIKIQKIESKCNNTGDENKKNKGRKRRDEIEDA